MIKSVPAMLDCLWGKGGPINRAHWEGKPFRSHFFKVRSALEGRPYLKSAWDKRFGEEFLKYHWLLPYPDNNGTLISTAKHTRKRQWWSAVLQVSTTGSAALWPEWGKARYRGGPVPVYPATLHMTRAELEAYLVTLR
jgi:hypothetical protein